MLTTPPVKKIDLHFPLGLHVTARNLKGVTIKDALDAIHKQFKKRVSVCTASIDLRSEYRSYHVILRPTTSSICHTWLDLNGTRRSHGLNSLYTCGRMLGNRCQARRKARRTNPPTSSK
jgi:hypothetical protein